MQKKITLRILSYIGVLLFTTMGIEAQNKAYKIDININGVSDTHCYLARYQGLSDKIIDTLKVDDNGNIIIEGDSLLESGVYMIFLPSHYFSFEFIINEPFFSLKTDIKDLNDSIQVTNSRENKLYVEYLKILKQLKNEEQAFKLKSDTDNLPDIKPSNDSIKSDIKIKQRFINQLNALIIDNSDCYYADILKVKKKIYSIQNGLNLPKPINWIKIRNDFFEDIDLHDEKLLKSPILRDLLDMFIRGLTRPYTLDIIQSMDILFAKINNNKSVYSYSLHYYIEYLANTNMNCKGKAYLHLVDEYMKNKNSYVMNKTKEYRLKERANNIRKSVCGAMAPNIKINDINNKPQALYDIDKPYTIIYFWDPGCITCKVSAPKLNNELESLIDSGIVEVFAVCLGAELEKWRNFIKEHKLNWVNVADPDYKNDFRQNYNIDITPTTIILDRNKNILIKNLLPSQTRLFIDYNLRKSKKNY